MLDSSTPDICAHNGRELKSFEPACTHVAFPTTTPMASKLFNGLSMVRTGYASFCADDDFVLPDAIREAVTFLSSNPDVVTAHGLYVNYSEDGEDVRIAVGYDGPRNSAEHAGARIFRLCQNYESLFYAVFRTSDLLTIFETLETIPTSTTRSFSSRLQPLSRARRIGSRVSTARAAWGTGPARAQRLADRLLVC